MSADDPAPTTRFSGLTLRAWAITRHKPSAWVGGDVRNTHGRCAATAFVTSGAGENHASKTSALMTLCLRSKLSNSSPIALKNAPPWKQEAAENAGTGSC